MRIINKAQLTYKEIGEIIDNIIETNKYETNYFGKKEAYHIDNFGRFRNRIKIEVEYKQRYVVWHFSVDNKEVNK